MPVCSAYPIRGITGPSPKRRFKIKMEYEGKMYSISELCKNFGFKETTLRRRHARGLDVYGNKIAG